MTDGKNLLPIDRFLWTLDIVRREGAQLQYSWDQLFVQRDATDPAWIASLASQPDEAVELEAFVSRFARMQDNIADKLIPRWLECLAERQGSQIENLNKAERLGIIESTESWLIARRLRNLLVHEYMNDVETFASALAEVKQLALMLINTQQRITEYAKTHMGITINQDTDR